MTSKRHPRLDLLLRLHICEGKCAARKKKHARLDTVPGSDISRVRPAPNPVENERLRQFARKPRLPSKTANPAGTHRACRVEDTRWSTRSIVGVSCVDRDPFVDLGGAVVGKFESAKR